MRRDDACLNFVKLVFSRRHRRMYVTVVRITTKDWSDNTVIYLTVLHYVETGSPCSMSDTV